MKKLLSFILSIFVMCTPLGVSAVAFDDPTDNMSLSKFNKATASLISQYEAVGVSNGVSTASDVYSEDSVSSENIVYQTNRLIVKSSEILDPLDSVEYIYGYDDLHIFQFDNRESFSRAYEYYEGLVCVEYVQEDLVYEETTVGEAVETDASIRENAIDYPCTVPATIFGYKPAKAQSDGSTVTVAVIDSGVQNDHELLEGRVISTGFNAHDENGTDYDDRGHGTHVAGIIAANTLSNVVIRSYKILNRSGNCTDIQLCNGIQAAIDDNVDIINLSLSRQGNSDLVEEKVAEAKAAGILVVCAAGNDSVDLKSNFYSPAGYDDYVVTVMACTNLKKIASFSNYGTLCDFAAPGDSVVSSDLDNSYKIRSGTSMAAPFIVAAAAYILAKTPDATPDEVEATLLSQAKSTAGTPSGKCVYPTTSVSLTTFTATPTLALSDCYFAGEMIVEISCTDTAAQILYSIDDGSTYREYTGPVTISETAVVQTFAIMDGKFNSKTATATYTKVAGEATDFIVNDAGILLAYNGSDGNVTVPTYSYGIPIVGIGDSAFENNTNLKTVILGDYVTSIGASAFKNCTELTQFVGQNVTVAGNEAFSGCEKLKTLSISAVTSIGESCFYNCQALTALTLNYITSIPASAFENTTALTSFSSAKVTTVGEKAFYNSGIKNFSGSSSSTVTSVGVSAFENCSRLSAITLNAVKAIPENCFKNCVLLASAYANAAASVGDYAFYNCEILATLEISNTTSVGDYSLSGINVVTLNLPKVTSYYTTSFLNCPSLVTLTLTKAQGEFKTDYIEGCPNITYLDLATASGITGTKTIAEAAPSLKTININNVSAIPDNMFNGCTALCEVIMDSAQSIGAYAFKDTNIMTLNAPAAATVGDYAFSGMKKLDYINVGAAVFNATMIDGDVSITKFNAPELLTIEDEFVVNSLMPLCQNFTAPKLTAIPDGMFRSSSYRLKNLTFDNALTVGDEAFYDSEVEILSLKGATAIGENAFFSCDGLYEIYLDGLETVNMEIFDYCDDELVVISVNGATSITASEGFFEDNGIYFCDFYAQSLESIPANAFKGNIYLRNVNIPSVETIGNNAFDGCKALTSITLDSVTSIGTEAFKGCVGITTFTAPVLESIDFSVLQDCENLIRLYLDGVKSLPQKEDGTFDFFNYEKLFVFSANSLPEVPANFLREAPCLVQVNFESATKVGDYAFYNTPLETKYFNENLLSKIGVYSFAGTNITQLGTPLSNVSHISDYAFANCSKLTNINSIKANSTGVGAFSGCTGLVNFTNSYIITLGERTFENCTALQSGRLNVVQTIGKEAFIGCAVMESLVVGDYLITVGEGAFKNCYFLESFTSSTAETIGAEAFKGCSALNNVTLNAVNTVGASAFEDCTFLQKLSGGGNLTHIGDAAFKNCSNLTGIKGDRRAYPEYIGAEAFYGCTNITPTKVSIQQARFIGDNAFAESGFMNSYYEYNLPLLETLTEDTLNGFGIAGLYLENVKTVEGIPADCPKVVLGGEVESFSVGNYDGIVYYIPNDVVKNGCLASNVAHLEINEKDSIVTNVANSFESYDQFLSFEAEGFNMQYQWYACNDIENLSDEYALPGAVYSEFDPMEYFYDDYKEGVYQYYYCVATSTQNGYTIEIVSDFCFNVFSSVQETDNTFIDHEAGAIYTDSTNNAGSFDGIFKINGEVEISPSLDTDTVDSYGTGTRITVRYDGKLWGSYVLIVNGDINGDGVVDVIDATAVGQAANGKLNLTGYYKTAADFLGASGTVDASEYQETINKALRS